jgi:hypothetical protein
MTESTLANLTKLARKFLWGGESSPMISWDRLAKPIEQGGLGVIDLSTRNQAITGMKLKTYIAQTPRPIWANFADALMANLITKASGSHEKEEMHILHIENWKINSHLLHKVPKFLADTEKFSRKHNLQ